MSISQIPLESDSALHGIYKRLVNSAKAVYGKAPAGLPALEWMRFAAALTDLKMALVGVHPTRDSPQA